MPLQITARDIKNAHPMRLQSQTDLYYAKVGNRLLQRLLRLPAREKMDGETVELIAKKVALYFEDVICDCGLWRSFVEKHRELYGRWLPFHEVDKDYMADEPHIEDIALIVWNVLLEMWKDKIVNPESPRIMQIAEAFYEILDDEFEKAPINEDLKEYFERAAFLDDYIEVRNELQWLAARCYLTAGRHRDEIFEREHENVCRLLHFDEEDDRGWYASMCQVFFKYKVGPLALLPQEWLALLLEKNGRQGQAEDVRRIEYRPFDLYRLEDFDAHFIHLSDTKERKISLRIDDYGDMQRSTLMKTDGCVAAYIKYRGEWHVNGMDTWNKFGEQHEKLREQKRRYKTGMAQKKFDALMQKSGGSPLFYFRNGMELRQFLMDDIGIPQHLMKPSEADDKEYIAFWVPSADEDFYIAPDAALYIKDPRNPYYNAAEARQHAVELITNDYFVEGDMVRYLISHDMLPDAAIVHGSGYELGHRQAQENLDFLARAIRRDQY